MRFALLFGLVGCAARPAHLYYEPMYEPLPALDPGIETELLQGWLARRIETGRLPQVTLVDPDGSKTVLESDDVDLVPDAAIWAGLLFRTPKLRGAELDLVVQSEAPDLPLTLRYGLDGSLLLSMGKALPAEPVPRTDLEAWAAELTRRVGAAGIVDGDATWTPAAMAALEQSLALLTPEELRVVRAVEYRRDGPSPRGRRELARYDWAHAARPTITAYDSAFQTTRLTFVGPLERPLNPALMTLTHEMGHGLAIEPMRRAWVHIDQLRALRPNADEQPGIAAALALARRDFREAARGGGPVIIGFREHWRGRAWPTGWSTNVHEAFAEAFALWKTDPDALQRVAPELSAWFDDGGHLAWQR